MFSLLSYPNAVHLETITRDNYKTPEHTKVNNFTEKMSEFLSRLSSWLGVLRFILWLHSTYGSRLVSEDPDKQIQSTSVLRESSAVRPIIFNGPLGYFQLMRLAPHFYKTER